MKVMIRLTRREELKALPILYRHSPGIALPNRIYLLSVEAAKTLRAAGIKFTELCREGTVIPPPEEGLKL